MTPEKLDPWLSIFANALAVLLGAFLLVFEAVIEKENANQWLIGVGFALVGVPPARFIDRRRRERVERILSGDETVEEWGGKERRRGPK